MDEEKTVEIKADIGTESIGKNAYIVKSNGKFDQEGFKASALVSGSLMVAVFIASFLGDKKLKSISGRELPSPNITEQVPISGPRVMMHGEVVNVVGRKSNERSALGKIKIVQLKNLSEIPVGSEVKARLESGATDGIVKAMLASPLIVDGEPILPERSTLFGRGRSAEERLYVEFQKVIFPSGETYAIRGQAFDASDKILGLKGALVGTRAKKMGMAMGLGFLGGMADGLKESSGSSVFGMQKKPSLRDGALSGASKATLDQSEAYLEEMKKSPNIIEVKAGTEFVLIIDEPRGKNEER